MALSEEYLETTSYKLKVSTAIIRTSSPPVLEDFRDYARGVKKSVTLISPFVTKYGVKNLVTVLPSTPLNIRLCSRFDGRTFKQGSSDFLALQILHDFNSEWEVEFYQLPSLHAKIYLFDDLCVVTSANLTQGGLRTNYEYGLVVQNVSSVQHLPEEIEKIITSSKRITLEEIAEIAGSAGVSPDDSIFITPQFLEISIDQGEQDLEPAQNRRKSLGEIELSCEFDNLVDQALSSQKPDLPIRKLAFIALKDSPSWDGNYQSPEYEQALNESRNTLRVLVTDWLSERRLPRSLTEPLVRQFAHKTVRQVLGGDLWGKSVEAHLMCSRIIGGYLVQLFLLHESFRGNYRWVEEIGYFPAGVEKAIDSFPAASILDEWRANWMLNIFDLGKHWQKAHLFALFGIFYESSPNLAWAQIAASVDADDLVEQGAFESRDFKTILQVVAQVHGVNFSYQQLGSSGPGHEPRFAFSANAFGYSATGEGLTKIEAMQSAARNLIARLVEKRVIPADSAVIERKPKKLTAYFCSEKSNKRIQAIKKLIPVQASDKLLDCALTTTAERHFNSHTRSNEKLAMVGAKLIAIYRQLHVIDNLNSERKIKIAGTTLSSSDFLLNMKTHVSGFADFLSQFYQNETKAAVESVCEALVATEWISGGWLRLNWLKGLMEGTYDDSGGKPAVTQIQEIRQADGLPPANYSFDTKGQGIEIEFRCKVEIDGICLGISNFHKAKKMAKEEAAQIALKAMTQST